MYKSDGSEVEIELRSGRIRLGEAGSFRTKTFGQTDGRVEYAPPGYLVFTRDGTLMAQPFDLGEAKPSGRSPKRLRNSRASPAGATVE